MPGVSGNIFGNVADIETRMADNTHPLLIRARQRRWQDERLVASIFQAWHEAGLTEHIRVWTPKECEDYAQRRFEELVQEGRVTRDDCSS